MQIPQTQKELDKVKELHFINRLRGRLGAGGDKCVIDVPVICPTLPEMQEVFLEQKEIMRRELLEIIYK
jgi:hypothetical protein